jgi:hypothetical protein
LVKEEFMKKQFFQHVIHLLFLFLILTISACYTDPDMPSTVADPTFSPEAGTYTSAQTVTISTSTNGAAIKYTIDGTNPKTSTTAAIGSIVSVLASETIKAYAIKTSMTDSNVVSATYTINSVESAAVADPTFSPKAGTYTSAQTVTISTSTNGAAIKYTIDGTNPKSSATAAIGSVVSVTASETIKAYAIKTSMTDSNVITALFTITEPTAATYNLGDTGPAGGIIFYDKGNYLNGWRYMEAAPTDQSTNSTWYNGTYFITGATGTAIGTGITNTTTIVSSQGVGSYAAEICDSLVLGGCDDWFLPSKDELSLIMNNVNRMILGGGFRGDDWYWSSSESNKYYAWAIHADGSPIQEGYKITPCYIRAIRAF